MKKIILKKVTTNKWSTDTTLKNGALFNGEKLNLIKQLNN